MQYDEKRTISGMPLWYAIYIPYKIGQAVISTIIPMLILSLGGTGTKVGLATMLFSLVTMTFAVVWGKLSDARELRKPFILIGIGGTILCLLLMYVSTTHLFVIICYALCAVLMAAEPPITPVYLLRNAHKSEWDRALSRFNTLCGWAWVSGLGLGAVLVYAVSLHTIALVTAAIVGLSLFTAHFWMPDAPVYLMRPRIAIMVSQVVERRRFLPNYVLHLPRLPHIRSSNNRLFFLASLILYVGTNLIYLPVIPYLTDRGLANSSIFVVIIANSIGSAVVYERIAPLISRRGCIAPLVTGVIGRLILILVMAACVLGVVPAPVVVFSAAFCLVGVTWPFIYLPSISFVTHAATEGTQGALMGKYNFVTTFGLMTGSLLAGYLYDNVSFIASLLGAAVLLVLSSAVFHRSVREPAACQSLNILQP